MTNVLEPRDADYRYELTRELGLPRLLVGPPRTVLFCALNPSTADAETDDQSSRKMVGFGRRLGFDRMALVNAYAARSTSPDNLRSFRDPVGPQNDRHIAHWARVADVVIAGWGNAPRGMPTTRFDEVLDLLSAYADVYRLGQQTKSGQPRHPLYLPYSSALALHRARRGDS